MRTAATLMLFAFAACEALSSQSAAAQTVELPSLEDAADMTAEAAAPELEYAAMVHDWVVALGDNQGRPFIIIDKVGATVSLYDSTGQLEGMAPALLGSAHGDESLPGIGDRELSNISPEDRTTPAGRFEATLGRALGMPRVLWVDYNSAVALHPVIRGRPTDHRADRLKSSTPLDNRITYGCINVPKTFFNNVLLPALGGAAGAVVYTLPEEKTLREAFPVFRALSGSR